MGDAGLSPALGAAARSLKVDAVTAEVVSKLREAAVRPILLKGPSIAAWLYADGTPRTYGDTDLLVAPHALQLASEVLRATGFREQPGVSSYTWYRRSDASTVDLHDTLFGVEASDGEAWALLSERAETMRVGGVELEILSSPARLLYVVLHAAQHENDGFERPMSDLERALRLLEETHWERATALARGLRALPTFAAGLRLHPAGAQLADRLDLASDRPLMLSLRAGPPLAATLESIATTRGTAARLRMLSRRLVPPPEYMGVRYPRLAARGRSGLTLAYLSRLTSIALRLPVAVAAWRRARRHASSGG